MILREVKTVFKSVKTWFYDKAGSMMNAILEAVTAIVVVILLDVYVVGSDNIINSATTIGAIVVPILQAVLLIAGILIAIGVLRSASKGAK